MANSLILRALAAITALLLTPAAYPANETARPVTLAEVKREVLREQAVLTGSTIPWRRAELSVRVDGLVTELFVDEGTMVAVGDPILTLDARLAEHDQAAAAARLREAEARHKDAIRVRDELLRLKRGRHASETETQSAIAQVEIAAAAMRGDQATLARARELVARHRLGAPFAGMVVTKHVEVGEWAKRDRAAVELVATPSRSGASMAPSWRAWPGATTGPAPSRCL